MSVVRLPAICDRARAQLSCHLDGELSQLETRMLASHLDQCADCCTFAAEVTAFTNPIRTAPLERLGHPVVVRPQRRVTLVRVQAGFAAALALAAIASALQFATPNTHRSASLPTPTRFGTSAQGAREMQQVIADAHAFRRHTHGSVRAI